MAIKGQKFKHYPEWALNKLTPNELADIKKQGEFQFIEECHRLLKEGNYHPSPVRRKYIPKKDGKQRPLGIPTIRRFDAVSEFEKL
ncbi:hypothetical protein [Paenibacillus sp. LPE1-1-1.1]|uniref:hypothetical protein n=1 Tax=Paenibacillus sp. LPE1-1-1.1 TaxID=3135230 RepID=UPI00342D38EC